MAVWIRTESLAGRSPPELPGLEQQNGEWRLRADYYEQFVEDVTGVDLADGLSASELKTVQTRLDELLVVVGTQPPFSVLLFQSG